MANGSSVVGTRFLTGGTPSLEGYSLNGVDQAIITPLDTSGSFTIGIVARGNLAVGSYSSATNTWWAISDNITASPTIGKIRMAIGGVTSAFTDYLGPALTATAWHYIVIIADRTAGTVRIRHNGVDALVKTGLSSSVTILPEFATGVFNAGSQSIRAAQYRSPISFTRALSDADLATLEAMLLEKTTTN